jgi:hypothetical protein
MPAGLLGNTGDDVTVFALADHQGGVTGSIGLEVADGREKLLVPATQQNPAAILKVLQPWLLIFNVKPPSPAVRADDVIKGALNQAHQQVSIFFQRRGLITAQI